MFLDLKLSVGLLCSARAGCRACAHCDSAASRVHIIVDLVIHWLFDCDMSAFLNKRACHATHNGLTSSGNMTVIAKCPFICRLSDWQHCSMQ